MIERNKHYFAVEKSVERSPVTAILGPRQCGKTTLERSFGEPHQAHYFDLESVVDQRRLQNPELMLSSLDGVIILDEIQYQPELFNLLRVLVDRPENKSRFVVLGSASPQLIKQSSETLAGRVEFIELSGFDLCEIDHLQNCGCGAAFPAPILLKQKRIVLHGEKDLFEHF